MSAPVSINFFIDENQPAHFLRAILGARGHQTTAVQVGFKDPAILVTAEEEQAVVITADTWFLKELYRVPITSKRNRFTRAGVVQVPGTWAEVRPRIMDYLPVIEVVYQLRLGHSDQRLGVDLCGSTIRILGL